MIEELEKGEELTRLKNIAKYFLELRKYVAEDVYALYAKPKMANEEVEHLTQGIPPSLTNLSY